MATFVLVHGSGDGGWVWQKVSPLLRAAGHDVYTPTLSGLSDRSHLVNCGVDLTMHVTDVVNLVTYEDLSQVVLVGHSYAGMVITGVAAQIPERLKMLVYLDAYLPDPGQSEVDLWPAEMRAGIEADASKNGGLRPPPPAALMGLTDPEMIAWVMARETPQPIATYTQPAPAGNALTAALARAFVHCTAGATTPVFAPFAAKARERGWKLYELATGHMAMLTVPRDVADILLDVAATG